MSIPFFIKYWNNVANSLEFFALHCLYCHRLWNPSEIPEAQPICFQHTVFITRLAKYQSEGKLPNPGMFDPFPPNCGRFSEK